MLFHAQLFFPSLMFFSGLLVFIFNYKYLLINLLSLEYMVLSLFLFIYLYLNFMNYEMFFILVFLSFSVCEGVMGLSLLISMVRNYGNNNLQSLMIFMC